MPTNAQLAANRRNARKSTGPQSPSGKATSSRNAVRHGLLTKTVTLPDEDQAEFLRFAEEMRSDFAPLG